MLKIAQQHQIDKDNNCLSFPAAFAEKKIKMSKSVKWI